MQLEYRFIHIDLLALPAHELKKQLSPNEQMLAAEYAEEFCVTRGFVLVTEPNKMRYPVQHGFNVVRSAKQAFVERVPCVVAETVTQEMIDLFGPAISSGGGESLPEAAAPEDAIRAAINTSNLVKLGNRSLRQAAQVDKLGAKSTLYEQQRLAENLDPRVADLYRSEKLKISAVKRITYVPKSKQLAFACAVIENGWSCREIELEIRKRKKRGDAAVDAKTKRDIKVFEKELEELLATTVRIKPNTQKTGVLNITFHWMNELTQILSLLEEACCSFSYTIKGSQNSGTNRKPGELQITYKSIDVLEAIAVKIRTIKPAVSHH